MSFPPGAKVYIDGEIIALVAQHFPTGSSSFAYPHYKVNIVDGDQNVAVHVKRISVNAKPNARHDAPYAWDDAKRAELSNLFHTARVALCGTGKPATRYEQRLYASREYSKAHPECSSTAAYKELDRADAWRNV